MAIMKASRVPIGRPLSYKRLDQRQDAGGVGVQRDTDGHGDQDTERVARAGVPGEEVLGCPAVDDRAEPDADQQVGPDLAEDGDDLFGAHLDALVEGQPGGGVDDLPSELGLEHERLDVAFEPEPAEHPAGDDRDHQTGADVEGGDLDPEQAQQQTDRDLVDQRAGDQEAHRHPERDAGRDEADERRHRAAGAERGDHAEARGHDVADTLTSTAQQRPGALDAHVGAQDRDHEDDAGEQQRDLDVS